MSNDQPMLSPSEPDHPQGGLRRPSATSVRPKGILKNAPSRQVSVDVGASDASGQPLSSTPGTEHHRLQWDEGNLALHDYEREQTTRMTIDEPKTPFVSSAPLAADDLPSSFSLDDGGNAGGSSSSTNGSTSGGSRRGSTASSAEITARNTLANAQLGRRPSATSVTGSVGDIGDSPAAGGSGGLGFLSSSAVESMAVDELEGGGGGSSAGLQPGAVPLSRSRNSSTSSRTPSFSLPRGSGGDDGLEEVRAARDLDPDGQDEIQEEEEDEETKAKHAAFAAKRNQHYGNEAQAMRIAAALAAQEEEDDDDEEEEEGGDGQQDDDGDDQGGSAGTSSSVPPVPPLPRINGNV